MINDAPAALGETAFHRLANNLGEGRGAALDGPGQRIAAERPESDRPDLWALARFERETIVVDHDERPAAANHRARLREIERDHGDSLLMEVDPDVELGPVRERKHADALAFPFAPIVKPPRLGALPFRIPAMLGIPKGEHALLGARALFIAPGAAERYVEPILVERLTQGLCLHDVGVHFGAVADRADAPGQALPIGMHDEPKSKLAGTTIAERDHLAEFPGRIDMQQRERQLRRIKRLECQMQEDGGVLADGIEQHRLVALGHSLADDVDAFGLELAEERELPGADQDEW